MGSAVIIDKCQKINTEASSAGKYLEKRKGTSSFLLRTHLTIAFLKASDVASKYSCASRQKEKMLKEISLFITKNKTLPLPLLKNTCSSLVSHSLVWFLTLFTGSF